MDERVVQFRVGVMVLATLIITVILVLLFGELPTVVQGRYTLYAHFPQAPGVNVETPVRKSGILIGRVTGVEFAQGDPGVIVTMAINSDIKLRQNEILQINTRSLLGDTELQFVLGSPDLPDDLIKPGDVLAGVVASDPLRVISNLEGGLAEALGSVASTSDEIGNLARRVSDLLDNNSEQLSRVAVKAEQALDNIRSITQSADSVLNDPELRADLKHTFDQFPLLLEDARSMVGNFKVTMDRVDRNLANLEGLTEPLGEQGEEIITNVNRALSRVDQMVGGITVLTRKLNDSEGSFNRFVSDPELYQSLVRTAREFEHLVKRLEPIIEDARVFSDKIARHPEDLGVRGVFRNRAGVK
jgi:phospholipid/cholesterol/gamma-HCH transport system substrate-binding protein